MTEILLTIALISTLILSYIERKDLYNRLMAKDLSDLKNNTQKDEPNQLEETNDDLIPIEEAREQIEENFNAEN